MNINEKIQHEFPWKQQEWEERCKGIARVIPAGAYVMDLGSGFSPLLKYLTEPLYTCIDKRPWTDITTVADFNKGEYPDMREAQYVVAQGILEYIDDKRTFLKEIRKYGSILLLTYKREGETEIEKLLPECGWRVEFKRPLWQQQFFYCSKI